PACPTDHESVPMKLRTEGSKVVKAQPQGTPMARKCSERPPGIARVDDSTRDWVPNLIRVRPDVDNRVAKLGRRWRVSGVIFVGSLPYRRITRVQKFVLAGVVPGKPLGIVFGPHPPRIPVRMA